MIDLRTAYKKKFEENGLNPCRELFCKISRTDFFTQRAAMMTHEIKGIKKIDKITFFS